MFSKRPTLGIGRRTDTGDIELRVIHQRVMRRFGLGYNCLASEWDMGGGLFLREMDGWKSKNAALVMVLNDASEVIDRIMKNPEGFSHHLFRSMFRAAHSGASGVLRALLST